MSLVCRGTNEALHRRGREVATALLEAGTSTYKLATEPSQEPIIPAADVFEETSTDLSDIARLPTIAECAIHLELLETFNVLREQILRSEEIDKSMGISPKREIKTGGLGDTKTLKDSTLEGRRQVKWTKYVELAVVRFLAWQASLVDSKPLDKAPPLDVLLVWHSFLLNPVLFKTHCQKEPLYKLEFPWRDIRACINNRDWSWTSDPDGPPELFHILANWHNYTASITITQNNRTTRNRDGTFPSFFSKPDPFALTNFSLTAAPPSVAAISPTIPIYPIGTALSKIYGNSNDNGNASDPNITSCSSSSLTLALATALFAAVIRQTSFTEKMHTHLWIRSPCTKGTLRRAISRYASFLYLMKSSRVKVKLAVPTLEIDLAWHTHQLSSGSRYANAMQILVGRFVNHDDGIDETKLGEGGKETSRAWMIEFGEGYRRCLCWDCETLVDELEREKKGGNEKVDMKVVVKGVEARVRYHRAVEAARRKGRALPIWEGNL